MLPRALSAQAPPLPGLPGQSEGEEHSGPLIAPLNPRTAEAGVQGQLGMRTASRHPEVCPPPEEEH